MAVTTISWKVQIMVLALVLLAFSSLADSQRMSTPPSPADLLLFNAHVITMDRTHPDAEALAIRADRFVWIGSNKDAGKISAARRIDLHGLTVLPGIIDAHTHLVSLGESLLRLNLKDAATEKEVVERVKQKAATIAPNQWILGWGWDEGKWASHYPTNEGLNKVAPNNPVYLIGLHGFAAWANRKALEIAGVTKDTKDPENGRIVRDEKTSEPTGVLLNRAQDLVSKHIPPLPLDQLKRGIELAAQQCIRNGLTSVHEALVGLRQLQAFRELVTEGRMPLRVYVMLDGADHALVTQWLERGPEIDPRHQFTIRSFKLFADGALGSRGAALLAPYGDAPETTGVITTPEAEVYQLARSSLQKGFQLSTHAIGDRTNRMVLDAYARALKATSEARDARLRIEHAQVLAPEDLPRFAALGVIPSMQPTHATSDMKWAEARLGPERIKGAYAWRSVLRTGAHLPLSSDFPGETLNPFYGIYAAITRQDPQGNPPDGWYPEQRLTLEEALHGYTIEGAYAEFEEKDKGSIEPGKLADLTIISENITKLSPKDILSTRVLKTIIGGKIVYDTDEALPASSSDSAWTLTWSDEFDGPNGSPPDTKTWIRESGGNGWGNNELEYYTTRLENSRLENGRLVIEARSERFTGLDGVARDYTSARLKTKGLFTQRYGRFEARIQIPFGQGIWPAFWMLGDDIPTVGWPTCGEIDIMENIGSEPSTIHGSMHGPGYSGAHPLTASYTLPAEKQSKAPRFADDFHIFAVEWDPERVRFYVDGHLYSTQTKADLPAGTRWVFDHPFFILLNVAIGGNWPGSPDASAVFPQRMLVDYVRAYERK
jgi:predicted amidohydrolase YtcJ/beta-glucanase (GH16 family)